MEFQEEQNGDGEDVQACAQQQDPEERQEESGPVEGPGWERGAQGDAGEGAEEADNAAAEQEEMCWQKKAQNEAQEQDGGAEGVDAVGGHPVARSFPAKMTVYD